jgi:hypothetical protein
VKTIVQISGICLVATTALAQPTAVSESTAPNVNPSIHAFVEACLKTAPSFAGAVKAAATFGITELSDSGFAKMGFNEDQSLGIQITEGKECVITTPNQSIRNLTQLFLDEVGRQVGAPAGTRVPVKLRVGNQTFIFMHDRDGGEAFVMLRPDA